MFEFGRELKRLLQPAPPRDGLTGGDASLLELLPLNLVCAEARAADIAAGRIPAPSTVRSASCEAAVIWREIARRTGDPVALRKAAADPRSGREGFRPSVPGPWAGPSGRLYPNRLARRSWARRCLGTKALNAAAEVALKEARKAAANAPAGSTADAALALVEARKALGQSDRDAVLAGGAGP